MCLVAANLKQRAHRGWVRAISRDALTYVYRKTVPVCKCFQMSKDLPLNLQGLFGLLEYVHDFRPPRDVSKQETRKVADSFRSSARVSSICLRSYFASSRQAVLIPNRCLLYFPAQLFHRLCFSNQGSKDAVVLVLSTIPRSP